MRGFCFDLDGVIADSTIPITTCLNRALSDLGLPGHPVGELLQYIGPPLITTFETLLAAAGFDPALAARCIDRYRHHYAAESLLSTTLYPGMLPLLAGLSAETELIVVTSKPLEAALPILEVLGVRHHFAAVHAPSFDDLAEPKTVTLRRAVADRRLEAAGSVMVGDRRFDVEAGRAVGLRTVGALWGFGSRAELELAGADQLARSPSELGPLLSHTGSAGSLFGLAAPSSG